MTKLALLKLLEKYPDHAVVILTYQDELHPVDTVEDGWWCSDSGEISFCRTNTYCHPAIRFR